MVVSRSVRPQQSHYDFITDNMVGPGRPGGNMTDDTKTDEAGRARSRQEKIRFWLSAASATLLFSSFTVFVFLIPFIIDPAVASLRGELSPQPVTCRVVSAQYRLGVSRCGWSSCREGCTQDIFQCHQVSSPVTSQPHNSSLHN